MWEIWVRSLSWGDPLEKEMATHSSILACKIPWTEEPGRLVHGVAKSWTWLSEHCVKSGNYDVIFLAIAFSPGSFSLFGLMGFTILLSRLIFSQRLKDSVADFWSCLICAAPSSPYCVLRILPSLSSFSNFCLCSSVRFLGSVWFLSPYVVVWKLCEAEMWGDLAHNVFCFHSLIHYSLAFPIVQP